MAETVSSPYPPLPLSSLSRKPLIDLHRLLAERLMRSILLVTRPRIVLRQVVGLSQRPMLYVDFTVCSPPRPGTPFPPRTSPLSLGWEP